MYNPTEYRITKKQLKESKRTIALMAVCMAVLVALCVMQVRATIEASDDAWRYREEAFDKQKEVDSLQHVVDQLEGEKWFVDNKLENR